MPSFFALSQSWCCSWCFNHREDHPVCAFSVSTFVLVCPGRHIRGPSLQRERKPHVTQVNHNSAVTCMQKHLQLLMSRSQKEQLQIRESGSKNKARSVRFPTSLQQPAGTLKVPAFEASESHPGCQIKRQKREPPASDAEFNLKSLLWDNIC